MQLMTLNSLLMFDIVFIFFLFLVGVTCLVYYLPPPALSTLRSTGKGPNGSQTLTTTCGTTTTCTGETVRFRRYSVGSLLSASDVSVGNHRFHSPLTADEDLVADCGGLEEILSLRGGSPILVAASPPPPPPAPFCSCCCVEHHQQRELQLLQQHLVENPHDLAPLVHGVEVDPASTAAAAAVASAIAGVDYVQIEIERTATDPVPPCCYVRAKDVDVRECHGPIHDV
ncbi:uncharacterized protein LOC110676167 [Aedes aegypti]|uniref:Uncharacterized protein n=1 Tax=Aedes aegypti TaxID=7159 RepID=A0A6I8U9M7_AEDAE|nr:uncharacterized protein LOC110676167 [Aedes aegypti]XP_021698669.1 uncharacterized protein LOC110676167 [Aedes aegypti]